MTLIYFYDCVISPIILQIFQTCKQEMRQRLESFARKLQLQGMLLLVQTSCRQLKRKKCWSISITAMWQASFTLYWRQLQIGLCCILTTKFWPRNEIVIARFVGMLRRISHIAIFTLTIPGEKKASFFFIAKSLTILRNISCITTFRYLEFYTHFIAIWNNKMDFTFKFSQIKRRKWNIICLDFFQTHR